MTWAGLPNDLDERIAALDPELRRIRRDIHRHPELGFEEHRTQSLVRAWLEGLGYAPRNSARTGLVADLRPDLHDHGGTIAIRADLDCLPIHETTDIPWRSIHPGRSHKCGHDGHTTIVMGLAALLAHHRDSAPANVRFIFQPAEEGAEGGGARIMVGEGVLTGVAEIYGLHNWPAFPKGEVRVQPGYMLAGTRTFEIELVGVGGHASQPQDCEDPIVAAAHMITALQTVVSRGLGHYGGAVVSVCSIHAGTASNIIPPTANLLGTIRSYEPAVTTRVLERLRRIVEATAAAHGVRAELRIEEGYPAVHNHPNCAAAVARAAACVLGSEHAVVRDGLPIAGGEDFAYFTDQIPGAYFFVGAGLEGTPGCHHPDFDFDDDLIPVGIRIFSEILRERLSGP